MCFGINTGAIRHGSFQERGGLRQPASVTPGVTAPDPMCQLRKHQKEFQISGSIVIITVVIISIAALAFSHYKPDEALGINKFSIFSLCVASYLTVTAVLATKMLKNTKKT